MTDIETNKIEGINYPYKLTFKYVYNNARILVCKKSKK